ncbi:hypothetical protein PoB_000986000 [Plakobranchus ocellatus]|uniref:Uncharacterized protein n=1 Tax=Plakobranchus ocellatus TaxID=259542 RepID=A0AAV3YKU0_9GAST|nr:hypothetical protein PoB_000986000 [Plakobranchus ocellatus]
MAALLVTKPGHDPQSAMSFSEKLEDNEFHVSLVDHFVNFKAHHFLKTAILTTEFRVDIDSNIFGGSIGKQEKKKVGGKNLVVLLSRFLTLTPEMLKKKQECATFIR